MRNEFYKLFANIALVCLKRKYGKPTVVCAILTKETFSSNWRERGDRNPIPVRPLSKIWFCLHSLTAWCFSLHSDFIFLIHELLSGHRSDWSFSQRCPKSKPMSMPGVTNYTSGFLFYRRFFHKSLFWKSKKQHHW